MLKTAMNFLIVFLLSVASAAKPSTLAAHPKDASNILPVSIVQALISKGLWSADLEISNNREGVLLTNFYQDITNSSVNAKAVANKLFNETDERNGFTVKSIMYSRKALLLRESFAFLSQERARALEAAVLEKYFNFAITLIRYSNVTEMDAILTRAKQLVSTNSVQLVDLTPQFTTQLASGKSSHRLKANDIRGAYIPSRKILAIDISNSVAENIISLTHELVHMADPEQEKNKAEMDKLFPTLMARLIQSFGGSSNIENLMTAMLKDVYFEIGVQGLPSIIDQMQKKHIESLKTQIEKEQNADLTNDPTLKRWNELVLKTTVENELQAYLYSLAVYQSLRANSKILPSSEERDLFIIKITDENFSFARTLAAAMNPFSSSTYLGQLAGSSEQSKEMKNQINILKGALEYHYLNEMQLALKSFPTKYSSMISFLKERVQAAVDNKEVLHDDILPKWAQPGQLESSVNPYTVLTAKLSTAWVIRFKESMTSLVSDIEKIGEPILLMRAGVLDLHDITFGELKLLGIQSKDSTSEDLPRMLRQELKTDLTIENLAFSKYLSLSDWKPTDFSSRGMISQVDLQASLYRLRLLKLLSWLETKFPIAAENMSSIKILQKQIFEGVYDHDELDEKRAQELSVELAEASKIAAFTSTDLSRANYLMKIVGGFYTLTKASDWYSISNRYQKRMKEVLRLLESNGYVSEFNAKQFESEYEKQLAGFKQSIESEFSFCRSNNEMQFIPSPKRFTVFNYSFPLTTICHNKNIYIFRRPGDLNESATTFIVNGRPESRIFFGSRPVRLEPFIGGER